MPETPTPCVNGQLLPAQGARSISSFEPAAKMVGSLAATASAGSFCLFCGNGVEGLPTVTSVSPLAARVACCRNIALTINVPTMAIRLINERRRPTLEREERSIQEPRFQYYCSWSKTCL